MSNRYQTLSWVTGTVNAGSTLTGDQTVGPSLFNIVKIKIVPDSGSETFNFRIYKDAARTKRLIRFEVQVPNLYQPVDRTAGLPGVEMYEGVPFPYDDDDATGKLHWEFVNNGVSNHTFTVTVLYEEVPLMSAAGAATFRGGYASNSILLTGATSGQVTVTVQAAAGTWTLTLPTSAGSSGQVLQTNGAGVTSWVTPSSAVASVTGTTNQVTASPTTGAVVLSTPQNIHTGATPQFAGLVVGTNPAASGDIRLANNAGITARNAANSGDYQLIRLNTNNQTELGVSGNDIAIATTVALGPTPATTGRIRLTNADLIYARNAANNANKGVIGLNASDQVEISTDGQDIKWGRALIALGGGAAPTFGTIGGSGPATAAQNTWMKVIDSAGAAFYVPAWK